MPYPQDLLDEIKLMARADHAHGHGLEYNPYESSTDRSAAWLEGWHAEQDSLHPLLEEVAKLQYLRVRAFIVADGRAAPLEELPREDWVHYTTSGKAKLGTEGVMFESREARSLYPDEKNVRIFIEYPVGADPT